MEESKILKDTQVLMADGIIFHITTMPLDSRFLGDEIVFVLKGAEPPFPTGRLKDLNKEMIMIEDVAKNLIVINPEIIRGWVPLVRYIFDSMNPDLQLHPEKYIKGEIKLEQI